MKDKKRREAFSQATICEERASFDVVHMCLSSIGTWFIIS